MNNYLRQVFQDAKDSFYNPTFYATLSQNRTLSRAVKFILFFTVLGALVGMVRMAVYTIPQVIDFAPMAFVEEAYPDELAIHIKNGKVETDVSMPYFVPNTLDDSEIPQDTYENLLVINTAADVSLDAVSSYKTALLLTKDQLIFRKSNSEIRAFSLSNVTDFTINKEIITGWANTLSTWLKIGIVPLLILGAILVALLAWVFKLIALLFYALIPLIVARLRGQKIAYKDAYIIAAYASSAVLILNILLSVFGLSSLPLLAALVIFTLVIVGNVAITKTVS